MSWATCIRGPASRIISLLMASLSGLVLLLSTLVCTSSTSAVHKNRTLFILTLLPYPDPFNGFNPSWKEGPSISLALDMARDQINNQTELLPDYHIELIHDDSGCEYTTKAYVSFMRHGYYSGNRLVGVLGPGCSLSAVAVAGLTSKENLTIVTLHGGGSPLLSNRTAYPYALSSLGTRSFLTTTAIKLIQESNWTLVGVLFDESRLFYSSNAQEFINSLDDMNLTVGFSSSIYETFIPLEVIMNKGLRINFLFTPVETTQRVLCLAMHRGMVYDAYQWIVSSNFFDEVAKDVNFTYIDRLYNCSEEDMKKAILNKVYFLNFKLSALNETAPSTYSKYSFKEYDQIFRERIDEYNSRSDVLNSSKISYSIWSTYFYDSLWAWSVVLDSLTRKYPSLDLTKYVYGNTAFSDMLMKEFYNLYFEGVSGRIEFHNESGSSVRTLSIVQIDNSNPQQVAYFDEVMGFVVTYTFVSISDRFIQIHRTSLVAAVIFLIIVLLQLATIIVLHVLTLTYHSYPSVKASGIKLNQFLHIGCYIFILAILLLTVQEIHQFSEYTMAVLCNLTTAWLLPISFTLTFGTVAVRTWRLYRIFTHYLHPSRFIGDFYLIAFLHFLVLVDIVIATVWVVVDPLKVKYLFLEVEAGVQVSKRVCFSENAAAMYTVVFVVRILLLGVVLLLAIQTRNIKNQSFTTKSLRVLVYLFSVVVITGFVTFFVSHFSNPSSSLSSTSLLTTYNIVLFLFIVFIYSPPLVPLLKEKYNLTAQSLKTK